MEKTVMRMLGMDMRSATTDMMDATLLPTRRAHRMYVIGATMSSVQLFRARIALSFAWSTSR
jgi:hypothetical protein